MPLLAEQNHWNHPMSTSLSVKLLRSFLSSDPCLPKNYILSFPIEQGYTLELSDDPTGTGNTIVTVKNEYLSLTFLYYFTTDSIRLVGTTGIVNLPIFQKFTNEIKDYISIEYMVNVVWSGLLYNIDATLATVKDHWSSLEYLKQLLPNPVSSKNLTLDGDKALTLDDESIVVF